MISSVVIFFSDPALQSAVIAKRNKTVIIELFSRTVSRRLISNVNALLRRRVCTLFYFR